MRSVSHAIKGALFAHFLYTIRSQFKDKFCLLCGGPMSMYKLPSCRSDKCINYVSESFKSLRESLKLL